MEQGDKNLNDILVLMDQLEGKVNSSACVENFSINEYKKIVNKFDEISINISNRKVSIGEQPQSRLDELSDIMTSIANLDFSKRAYISKDNNYLDYLATGLNLISFHLEKAIKPLLACRDFFEDDSMGIFIIDADGQLIYHNKLIKRFLGYKNNEYLPEDMSHLLNDLKGLNKNFTEFEFKAFDPKGGEQSLISKAKKNISKKGVVNYYIQVPISQNLQKCDQMFEVLIQIKSALEDKSDLKLAEFFWLNQINKLFSE